MALTFNDETVNQAYALYVAARNEYWRVHGIFSSLNSSDPQYAAAVQAKNEAFSDMLDKQLAYNHARFNATDKQASEVFAPSLLGGRPEHWDAVPFFSGPGQQRSAKIRSGSAHKSNTDLLGLTDIDDLKTTYNKHIYTSPNASPDGTRLKLGPMTYGAEVQSIRILEEKAIRAIRGVRSASDFLSDDGIGEADVLISMIFSGQEHIEQALYPLIALFRLSPITSVQNDVIRGALYTEFTENAVEPPDRTLVEQFRNRTIIEAHNLRKNHILTVLGLPPGTAITQAIFDKAQDLGAIPGPTELTYQEFLGEAQGESRYLTTPIDELRASDTVDGADRLNPHFDLNKRIDRTGHVPMAFLGMEVKTHPELPDSLLVDIFMKRVNVGNYLNQFLQYRTINNTPTPDAREAFWLNRAVDIYIERFLPRTFTDLQSFGKTVIKYRGDDVELEAFRDANELQALSVNDSRSKAEGTVVTQLSYSMYHKFSFSRLAGETYPTCQHMGTQSGILNMSIRTNNPEMYEKIHGYKSAADFFVRHEDKVVRFSGWEIDNPLIRLFNFSADAARERNLNENIDRSGKGLWDRCFYPKVVTTVTNDESPKLRDINISFLETNPDFFSDFGFTIAKGGYNIESLHKFFRFLYDRANAVRLARQGGAALDTDNSLDYYAFETFFGTGDSGVKFNILNPDTITAAILEPQIYDANSGALREDNELSVNLLLDLIGDDRLTGTIDIAGNGLEILLQELATLGGVFTNIELNNNDNITGILDKYFEVGPLINPFVKADIARAIKQIADEAGREQLYRFIFNRPDIALTDAFIDKLFTAIVKRTKPPISERVYDRVGVIQAFNALTLAFEAIADDDEFLGAEGTDALAQRDASEAKVKLRADGRINKSQELLSAYNDYMFLTYEHLFDIEVGGQTLTDYWINFGYTYQDMGIINPNFSQYGDEDTTSSAPATFSDSIIENAQRQILTKPGSAVPPSVFFFRASELEQFRINMTREYGDWFSKMSSLVIDLPFDVERFTRDEDGHYQGKDDQVFDVEENLNGHIGPQTSTLIKQAVRKIAEQDPNRLVKAAEDIIAFEASQIFGAEDDNDFRKRAKDLISKPLTKEYYDSISWFSAVAREGISVPLMLGTHINSPVATYTNMTGVGGEGVARVIVNAAAEQRGETFKKFVDQTLTKAAGGGFQDVTISSANLEEVRAAMLKISQKVADNNNDIIRAFPVMRMYLVEPRGPRVLVQDNFFGYHAIESIDITLDKNDASLAVIRIADPLHLLQGDAFGDEPDRHGVADDLVLPVSNDDQGDFRILERIKLAQGRHVQIRGGYSADADNLDILFTGRIAEVQYGDVVTVVAQGWKAELMGRQVEFELNRKVDSSVKDLVVRTIRDANPAGIGDVYSAEEFRRIRDVSPLLSAQEIIAQARRQQLGTTGGDSGASGTEGFNILGFTILDQLGAGLDTRLKNIWVPDRDTERFNFFGDVISAGWHGSRWVVPLTPAWEVLENATNYVWGYINQVVPFDGESTLFFGRPDQMYFYTRGDARTARSYRKLKDSSIALLARSFSTIMNGFLESRQFNGPSMSRQIADMYVFQPFPVSSGSPANGADGVDALDYLEGKYGIRDIHTNRRFIITPENNSFITFKTIDQKLRNDPDNSGSGIFGRFSATTQKQVLAKSLVHHFDTIADILENDQVAAIFMMSAFFGFSPVYIQNNFGSIVNFMRLIMGPLDEDRISEIRQRLGDTIQSAAEVRQGLGIQRTIDDSEIKAQRLKHEPTIQAFLQWVETGRGADTDSFGLTPGSTEATRQIVEDMREYWLASGLTSKAYTLDQWRRVRKANPALAKENGFPTPEELISSASAFRDRKVRTSQAQKSIFASQGLTISDSIFSVIAKKLGNEYITKEIRDGSQKEVVDVMINNIYLFKSFVFFLSKWLRGYYNSGDIDQETKEAIDFISDDLTFDFPSAHNMKVFRDYHYIRNGVDIVTNNIAATTREMFNTVVMRYPAEQVTSNDWPLVPDFIQRAISGNEEQTQISAETEWTSWPPPTRGHIGLQFDDSVTLADKKIGVFTDINVTREDQAAKVATNMLTKYMRSMYRNDLCLLGRVIKPWDQLIINDKFIDMYGPVEVERVVHHYSAEDGWKTHIVPHAVCEANPGNRHLQAAVFASKMDRIYDAVDYAFWAIAIALAIPTAGASLGAGLAARQALASTLKAGARQGLKTAAGTAFKRGNVAGQIRLAKRYLQRDSTRLFKTYLTTSAIQAGIGEISRLVQVNAGAGDKRLPVIFSPLLYKGVPFEAGLHGSEFTYWSIGAKLHWAWKHTVDGIGTIADVFTSAFTPDPSDDELVLGRLAGLHGLVDRENR